jgi:hypothetical protein
MKLKPRNFQILTLSGLALSTLAATQPARAVVLEAKWLAGQQLSYDLKLDGTIHLTAPEGTPMIAGLPLELLVKGDGQSTLVTGEVDEFGTAVVAARMERLQFKMNETTFNQNAVLGVREGKASFTLNGQSVMPTTDVSRFLNSQGGLRITKQMHVVGAVPSKKASAATDTDADAAPATGDKPAKAGKKTPFAIPLNVAAMMQAMMARTLPAILPTRDIGAGDEWSANVEWPIPPAFQTPALKEALQNPAGQFAMKAVGEEDINGRKAWRIAVDGTLQVDEAQAKIIADEIEKQRVANAPKGEAKPDDVKNVLPFGMTPPKFFSFKQKIKGDFWFDAVAGQVVRGDFNVNAAAQSRKDDKGKADGSTDFVGNIKLDLRKVSYENQ